ncbi:MAG TPA: PEP/pyruvate-binding domain-containing protein [Actinomycetota bacterium]|nr:PEP/pyruvate-binding domain-containing protein [Actinomycetota bacterium]
MAAMRAIDSGATRASFLLDLSDVRADDPNLAGAKAATLARARRHGFPVLPGFVITTEAKGPQALDDPSVRTDLHDRWFSLTAGGQSRVVVRSSSISEDGVESSMAGMFRSVTNIGSWTDFVAAIEEVYASAVTPLRNEPEPMAVLVQLQLDAAVGGVMFGVDPIAGRRDRIVIAAVSGSPEKLVSGDTEGTQYVLNQRGRVVERVTGSDDVRISQWQRRRLSAMARRAADAFGRPQDIEWAEDYYGQLWMLQTRPVTAIATQLSPRGPLLGPGPVAETFPDALAPLEQELWLDPFRDGLRSALEIAGTRPRKQIAASPIVVAVEGRAAVDLQLLDAAPTKRSFLSRLDPRPPTRRLAAAWRIGRLAAALPGLAKDLQRRVDDELESIGPLSAISDSELVTLLDRSRRMLVSLHGHEALAGMLMRPGATAATAASTALRALADARRFDVPEDQIVSLYPEVLALSSPSIGRDQQLPPAPPQMSSPEDADDVLAAAREALRFEARLVQELSARAAVELGRRAVLAGTLSTAQDVKWLRLDEIEALVAGRLIPLDVSATQVMEEPLPSAFRLSPSGAIVPERSIKPKSSGGQGAGGGRASGPVRSSTDELNPGDILVTRTLDPQLAGVLPILGGLVAETGSVLSHLAILAREFGVPTVVSVPNALERFPAGSTIFVDGVEGEVSVVEPEKVNQ